MNKHLPWLLLPLAALGIWLSIDLVATHFNLLYNPKLALDSWCDVSDTISCAAVNQSKWSALSMGEGRAELPVALPAAGFFAALALLGFLATGEDEAKRRRTLSLAALFVAPALTFSVFLIGVQAVMGTWCLKCLLMDATVLAALLVTWFAHGGGLRGLLDDLKPLPWGLGLSAVALMAAVIWVRYDGYADDVVAAQASQGKPSVTAGAADADEEQAQIEEAREAIVEFLDKYDSLPVYEVPELPDDGTEGAPESTLVVTEFADFQCPHCRLAGYFLKDIAHRYGDRVRFVFKNYPLDNSCNDSMRRPMHKWSCKAAVAAICAGRQGNFWDYHDLTFDSMQHLNDDKFEQIAGEVNLDVGSWKQCLGRDDVMASIKAQIAQGRSAGITGTPTFFVNGKLLPAAHPLFVEAALRRELTDRGEMSLPEDPDGLFPRM